MNKVEIMDEKEMERTITRISYEIIEKNKGINNLILVGIQRRGVPLAKMISKTIALVEKKEVPIGTLDITLYRDDLKLLSQCPILNGSDISFSINNKKIILIDDVIYTGCTARTAIEAIMDLGQPENLQLAVLIDRGHRRFPISPDYVGRNVQTSKAELVNVNVSDVDGFSNVIIVNSVSKE